MKVSKSITDFRVRERNKEIIEMSTFEVTDEIKERVSNYQIFKMHDEINDLKS